MIPAQDFAYLGRVVVRLSAEDRAERLEEIAGRVRQEEQMLAGTLAAMAAATLLAQFPGARIAWFEISGGYGEDDVARLVQLEGDGPGAEIEIHPDFLPTPAAVVEAEQRVGAATTLGLRLPVDQGYWGDALYRLVLADPLQHVTFS